MLALAKDKQSCNDNEPRLKHHGKGQMLLKKPPRVTPNSKREYLKGVTAGISPACKVGALQSQIAHAYPWAWITLFEDIKVGD